MVMRSVGILFGARAKSDADGIWTHANEDNGLNVAP